MAYYPSLWLNLIPVTIDSITFDGYELPYQDDNQLKELRDAYRESHVVVRNEEFIRCVPRSTSTEVLGTPKQFSVKEEFVLVKHLVQDALIRLFYEKRIPIAQLRNPTTLVYETKNLVSSIITHPGLPSLVSLHPEYQIESRLIVPDDKRVVFGILVNFGIRQVIRASVKDLIDLEVDVANRYVVREKEWVSPYVETKFSRELAGRISRIDGDIVHLLDPRDSHTVRVDQCYLEPSIGNFLHCIDRGAFEGCRRGPPQEKGTR